jgi:tRNA (guanine10-N2)-dimethyltransferase
MYIAITGRERQLALAELEALFDSSLITPFSKHAALIDADSAPKLFRQIGSSIKLAKVIDIVDANGFNVDQWLDQNATNSIELTSNRKMNLGISCYGADELHRPLFKGLNRVLSAADKNVRTINPKHKARMSSAQVFHNKLDMPRNLEFVCIKNGSKLALATTTNVQNITAYRVRDRNRPKRDAVVGMLPPKLAQTLVNLSGVSSTAVGKTLLDPFCGTGVTLIEAGLMGFTLLGSDIEQRMIDYTEENLKWVDSEKNLPSWQLERGDAQKLQWPKQVDTVVSEIYLGDPLDETPSAVQRSRLESEARDLIINFLENLHSQLESGTPVVLATPAWRKKQQFEPAITLDDLERLGYNRIDFQHVDTTELIYARPNQYVGRKIFVMKRV